MIKFVGAAVWICLATLGAVFFAFQSAGAKPETAAGADESMMGGIDYVKTDVISVPLIRDSAVQGYFLARLVYTVDPKELKKLKVPAEALITDVVYSYVYSSPRLDFAKTKTLDLDAFRNDIRSRINAEVKQDLVRDVLVEQVDYLTKDEIRDNAVQRHKKVAGTITGKSDHAPAASEHGAQAGAGD